jgi:integrase
VATKTAAVWSIRIGRPLEELLFRQRQRSYVGREGSWVFPNSKGGHLNYRNWLGRGWPQALERARVKPREGDAQKALRRSYITSALICGRNPKLVSSEVGHTTARMVLETYDSFIDPANWPDTEEREHLSSIFGWDGDEIVGSGARATHALRKAR